MPHSDFVHLRLHTSYSLLEGAIKVNDLVKKCQEFEMPAVGITDTGNLFGALDFSTCCAEAGIQPIIGCQLGVSNEYSQTFNGDSHSNYKTLKHTKNSNSDQILIFAQNEVGYGNLLQLVSKFHLGINEQNNNQISYELIKEYGEGLIAFTGGPAGGVGSLLAEGKLDEANSLLSKLKDIFKDRLYVEVMRHNLEIEARIENLICISEGTYLEQSERRRLTPEHRLKSPTEMKSLFEDLPEAINNTILVAKRCSKMAETRPPLLPTAPKSEKDTRNDGDVLKDLAISGLEERLKSFSFGYKENSSSIEVIFL